MIAEVVIGSSFDVIVEYEHSSQEDKVEVERVLSEALQFGSSKLSRTGIHLLQKGDSIRTESLRISIRGNLKKEVFLSNVSEKDIRQLIILIIANIFKFYQLNDFLDNLNKSPAEYLFINEPIRAKLVPIDLFIPKLSLHLRSKIGKF